MLISFLVGVLVGIGLLLLYHRIVAQRVRRIPRQWPLTLRACVNNREKRVWIWLAKVMFDHQVLVKIPVTRFTAPSKQDDADHWYKLLNGVYCTFTICSVEGKVIGCVDVPGPKGISLSNQTLKHTLLMQCGLHYWVVDPANLPPLSLIRTAFLGVEAGKIQPPVPLDDQFNHVREHLKAAVSRQRETKTAQIARLDLELPNSAESRPPSGWEQNSFVSPLDSRNADV